MKRITTFTFKAFVALLLLVSFESCAYTQPGEDTKATIYYVSLQGSDENTGLSEARAWRHISYAASRVVAGDKVFVKAGNYGNENIVFSNSGSKEKAITIEGYQNNPGDKPDLRWKYADELNASVMPLLDGGDRAMGIAIDLSSKSFISFKNFQIRNYETGVYAWGANNLSLENIIGMSFGDINADYSGGGIIIGAEAHNNLIKNCIILNAAAEAISVVGDKNIVEACQVYADDNSTGYRSATDYYIHISGNNNLVDSCYAERIGDLEHGGHGIGIKGKGENNLIKDSVAKNFVGAFYLRHSGVKNNVIENCTAINGEIGLLIRDGANHNSISNCKTFNVQNAVAFMFTKEDENAKTAGNDNLFKNCLFKDSTISVISFNKYSDDAVAENNNFENSVFIGSPVLFDSERSNKNNKISNSIITEIAAYKSGSYEPDIEFNYNLFWNNGFATEGANNNISLEPLFVDAAKNDFHLRSQYGRWDDDSKTWLTDNETSPAIDAGDPDALYGLEPKPNGNRLNLGIFGNTPYASKSKP